MRKTVAQQVREFGSRVKKDGPSGYYEYIGKNFNAKFNSEFCESFWWEVNFWDDDANPIVVEKFTDYNRFDTKKETVFQLLQLDKYWDEETSKS